MILFLGCSYTWGSGLQYEYLHNEKGWSIEEINKVLPYNYHLEHLSYGADEYRKQNNWPNLVSKEINKAYVIGTYTNGGSNMTTIVHSIDHCHKIARANSISTVIVQFTDWLRDVDNEKIQKLLGDLCLNTFFLIYLLFYLIQIYDQSTVLKKMAKNLILCMAIFD